MPLAARHARHSPLFAAEQLSEALDVGTCNSQASTNLETKTARDARPQMFLGPKRPHMIA
jgi:hypothetical protein